jgi:hypothetical protein
MRFPVPALSLALLLASPLQVLAASNPIPGVGIVVKRPPGTSTALVVPGGFFGGGSAAFAGGVGLEGSCSHQCGGCDSDCGGGPPDGRIDYAADTAAGPFDTSLSAMTLYSVEPIAVGSSFFDVFVTLSGPGPLPDDPIPGIIVTAEGQELDTGSSALVQSGSVDLHATITFADHATGIAAGSSLEQDLHLALQEAALPIARVADGTATGHIVLGGNGATVTPFTYASAGGGLSLRLLSLEPGAPVPARAKSWGQVKAVHR